MKKGLLIMMALTLFLSLSFVQEADARRGGIKSPKQGFTQSPKKTDNVSQTNNKANSSATGAATTGKTGGLIGGGGLMKGLMLGGLAGMLFGGLFGGMGALGQMLGLLVNLLAIFAIIMLIRVAFVYLRERKNNPPNTPNERRPY